MRGSRERGETRAVQGVQMGFLPPSIMELAVGISTGGVGGLVRALVKI